MPELRSYQEIGINNLARKVSQGKRKLIFQMATGSGKTPTFAGLVHRFLNRQQKKALILVNRDELLKQGYKTFYHWYEIVAVPVTAGQTYLPNAMVYIAMVETANNRLKKNPAYFGNIGLVIVDEAHFGNYTKLYQYFPDALIIGFTATPKAAKKTEPLNKYFDDIVCGIDIPELIQMGALVPNRTYHVENINRKELKMSKGEFDETEMGKIFSSGRHVQNTIAAYKKYADGTKAIVFNCNKDHCRRMHETFLAFGYPSRYLDGDTPDQERENILKWFASTPGAILNNINVATTGFDEPSIETVIMNRATASDPLWLQCTGRAARPYDGKPFFNIIDMGGNAITHGDWCQPRDWADIFRNPERPRQGGEAPLKACKGCAVMIHLSQRTCPHCGADNYKAPRYDEGRAQMGALSTERKIFIDVAGLIREYDGKKKADGSAYKEMAVLHEIKRQVVNTVKRSWKVRRLDPETATYITGIYQDYVKQWCLQKGKIYTPWLATASREWMEAEYLRLWKYGVKKEAL